MERIITKYIGDQKGPMLLVFGGMHGNEPAGAKAIEMVSKMLEVEPITNKNFYYKGSFIGMLGNKQASQLSERYIHRDLNRSWTVENVHRVTSTDIEKLEAEDLELREIIDEVHALIAEYAPEKLIVLDLHTTSSSGGIFSLPTENPESLSIAKQLHAPVIKGMLQGIQGTVLHYFNTKNMGIETTAIAFESGQHTEALSVNRAIAAIVNCMRTIKSIDPSHVEHEHDDILIEYSKSLPKVAKLVAKYSVKEDGKFKMRPDYKNFQRIKKGEKLAFDDAEEVSSPEDGLILMPLYQKRGEDGFFLVKEIS